MGEIQTPDWRDLDIPPKRLAALEIAAERALEVEFTQFHPVNNFKLPDAYDITWMNDGACKGIDTNLIMPERKKEAKHKQQLIQQSG